MAEAKTTKPQNTLVQRALSQLRLFGADQVTGDLIMALCQEIETLENALRQQRKTAKKPRRDNKIQPLVRIDES